MTKKEIRQIYAELCAEMTSEEFLKAAGLEKETVEMLLNREYWEAQLSSLFPIKKSSIKSDMIYGGVATHAVCNKQ